jgi:hypothetical protein
LDGGKGYPSGVQNSPFGSLGKRIVAWAVLVLAALLALKVVAAIFFGVLQAVFMVFLLVVAAFGVLWALRHV